MLKKLHLHIIFLFLSFNTGYTQINIKLNDNILHYKNEKIEFALSDSNNFTKDYLKKINDSNDWSIYNNKQINYSYSPKCLWLKIPVSSISGNQLDFVSIKNPHINFVKCWLVIKDSIIKDFPLTGDHLQFASRPIKNNHFVFPLQKFDCDSASIIIAFDKRYTKLDIPICFYDTNSFIESVHTENILIGSSAGILMLFLFISSLLFFFTKEKLHLIYSMYLMLLVLYIFIDNGILFEFIYPNYPQVNDLMRPGVSLFSIVPLLFFFFELLNFKNHSPKLHRFNLKMILCYLIIFCVAMINAAMSLQNQGNWLRLGSILVPSIFLIFFLEICYFVYLKVKYSRLALLSLLIIISSIILISLEKNELIPQNSFTINITIWGVILLTTIMLLAIFLHYKNLKLQSEELIEENQLQKINFLKEITEWEKEQMQRISSFMHDNVGANLCLLRLDIDKMKLDETNREILAKHILELYNEVRDMSHAYSPLNLKKIGLYNSIDNIVERINNNSLISLTFQFNDSNIAIKDEYQIIVFRIVQELLNNLLKHSKAQTAFLEVMLFKNLISVYIEDDGIGFQNLKQDKSLGLRSIENIVSMLKGTCIINSIINGGTNISIEFKISDYEKI
jgi:signal transduction histidine kinase